MRAFVRTRRSWILVFATAVVGFVAACSDATAPPKAVTIVFLGDANQSGVVGTAIVPGPTIQIRDSKGSPLKGVAFTVSVGGGGSLIGTPAKTVDGTTSLGTWTLGTTAGPQSLTVASTGLPSLTITANATPATPSASSSGGIPTTSAGRVGQAAAAQPQIKLLDAFGNAVAGVSVTVQITGGGTVQNSSPVTNSQGVASVGTWTFGTIAGTQRVTLLAGGLVTPVIYTAVVEAGPATNANPVGLTTASGSTGSVAPISPSIKIVDSFGNGVAGVVVSATLGAGSGSITNPNPVTDATGVGSVGVWTLGASATQTITLSAPGFLPIVFTVNATTNQYSVQVRFVGGTPSATAQAAFLAAAARIQQVIIGDVADVTVSSLDVSPCFDPPFPGGSLAVPPLTETLDDIVIYARVGTIDGPSNTAGIGGPCFVRTNGGLPLIGRMQFDVADIDGLAAAGLLGGVVLHEMLHAIGIGTLWMPGGGFSNLATGILGANPIFLGAQARTQFVAAGGTTPSGVPLENVGGSGTRDGHWRQANLFVNELMTGTIFGATRPFSAITMAALGDFGYQISLATAETFAVQPPGAVRSDLVATPRVLLEPQLAVPFAIDDKGRVTPLIGPLRSSVKR